MLKKAIFCISLILILSTAWSQSKNIRFRRLTINDGLSLSSVYCIYQDSKGFMWFGTEDGLNRYDGKNFKIFRPDAGNKNSISHKWIDQVLEDKSGNLWFGSRGGLTKYNPKKEAFTQYKNNLDESNKLCNDTIICLLEDDEDRLWIGTIGGLNVIDLKNGIATQINTDYHEPKKLRNRINALYYSKKENIIWIGTDLGLYFYDKQIKKFAKSEINLAGNHDFRVLSVAESKSSLLLGTTIGLISYFHADKTTEIHQIPASIENPNPDQAIETIYPGKNEQIWIVTSNGLYEFKQNEKVFKLYVSADDVSNSQSINPIKPIIEDELGNIWYGTFGTGLYKIAPDGFINHFTNNPADQKSLSYNSIHSMFEDRAGVIWFGTFGAGLSIFDPQSHKFDLITNNPNDQNSLSTNFVWSIMEATDGSLWIGTNNNGISRYFPKKNHFVHYISNPGENGSLSNQTIRYIFQDRKGTIWIATDGGGLNKFIAETGKFKHYISVPNNTTSISNNYVRGIYEDNAGHLWIGTRQGLNKFNPETEKFKRYFYSSSKPSSISHNYIYTGIHQDKKGFLWVGTIGGGLNKMDVSNETFKSYVNNPKDPESLSDNMVFWIYEDKHGILWIGTNSGLNRFDPETEKFKRFGTKEGLPNDVIYGVLPDEDNNLWLSTNYGLCRFNLSSYGTKNYDVNDGLQSNEFNGGSFHLGKSGRMYFGGIYGLNIVNPKNLKVSVNKSELAITKFEIFGEEVLVLDSSKNTNSKNSKNTIIEKDGKYYFSESISYTDGVVLDYSNNFFSLEFAALNTPLPNKVQYAYMMENLDNDWNNSGNRNFVSYARLKPGTYVFKVRAQNSDGLWSNSIAKLNIKVNPPFWKTWWFILLEILLALNLIMLIYRYLLKAKTNKLLKAQNEQITFANQQLSESEKNLKELNATKDKFFSIISHDLKNPFSSLLSMSESVSESFQTLDDEDKHTIFIKIHESVKQIYNLLNNLLTWSRSQSKRISFEQVEFSISSLIEININLHRPLAEKKGIKLISDYDENIRAFADREMINTVIRNLFSNAIKFSNNGDSIEIMAIKRGPVIEIQIKDQGIGISAENQEKLFRIDVKFKSNGTSGEKGTGLGLILCKEFVEKNGGQIKVESMEGKGSIFRFTVPIK
ncbi:MAG: two-component regulator propeller domain-containing protein [Bacteroidales bacterium]|nr:two-component regulator propeller domain-containing protein [Bacteroidales bacterium]